MKVIIAILIILSAVYFISQDGHVRVNNQRAGFFLLKGGYRSWWISYSDGIMLRDNEQVNLWRWPSFEHVDVL